MIRILHFLIGQLLNSRSLKKLCRLTIVDCRLSIGTVAFWTFASWPQTVPDFSTNFETKVRFALSEQRSGIFFFREAEREI